MTMMRMSSVLLVVVICVSVRAGHGYDPKLLRASEEFEAIVRGKREVCPPSNAQRNEYIINSNCEVPKDVLQPLIPDASYKEISPEAVWVKQCVGNCHSNKCVPITKQSKLIPVRIFSIKTDKESCAMYEVEEHLTCGCCAEGGTACTS